MITYSSYMQKGDYLLSIYRLKATVFSLREIMMVWGEADLAKASVRINYYKRQGKLYHIRRGFYARDNLYDRKELACKVYTPCYISFETVLKESGVIFQHHSSIFIASYLSRSITVDNQTIYYRKIKETILTDLAGIIQNDTYCTATTERALLDMLYLNPNFYFDYLGDINWKNVFEILPIYKNKRLETEVYRLKNSHDK